MDATTPNSRRSTKPRLTINSSTRLSRLTTTNFQQQSSSSPSPTPRLTLDLLPSAHITAATSSMTSSPSPTAAALPVRELLLLSPSPSPLGRKSSKTRLADRLVDRDGSGWAEETAAMEQVGVGPRRKCKNRSGLVCGSPRNGRRPRRRVETEVDRDVGGVVEEVGLGRGKRRRNSGRSKKDKLGSVPSVPSPGSSDGDLSNLDRIGQLVTDLIMWNDVAKSSLWFGFGSLCILSSCFAKGVSFSIFTLISQLGLLLLGLSFFSSSIYQRVDEENRREFKLKDDDILRVARVILPTLNLAISKTRELFSGEPTMTLKVAPILLIGSDYGHLMTLRRLCALVECLKRRVLEAWRACSHKKVVVASIATAFWNLTSIRTRTFAAFISLVILRYNRQNLKMELDSKTEEEEEGEAKEGEQEQKALVIVERAG